MSRPLSLEGMPNREELLAEARRRGMEVELVRRTGEVRVRSPHGVVTVNNRRKSGTRALVALLRKGA